MKTACVIVAVIVLNSCAGITSVSIDTPWASASKSKSGALVVITKEFAPVIPSK